MTLPKPGRIYPDLETRREIEAKARREAYEQAVDAAKEYIMQNREKFAGIDVTGLFDAIRGNRNARKITDR